MKGIDVSVWQGTINWNKVKESGIDFAMIKATQGSSEKNPKNRNFPDRCFSRNMIEAEKAGIPCGVYHYFTATNEKEVKQEAEFFLRTIAQHRKRIKLWAAIDVESFFIDNISGGVLLRLIQQFADIVRDAGYKPMLYTNPSFLTYRLDAGQFKGLDIWLAFWTKKTFAPVDSIKIWQYGSGRVEGIVGNVDMNEGYFDVSDFVKPAKPDCKPQIKAGDHFVIKPDTYYTNGVRVPNRLYGRKYRVLRVKPNAVLLDKIMSWVKL